MVQIILENIIKEYGNGFRAVNNINLSIADDEFMIFVGPSGCGKPTTLRMIVGLKDTTSGNLLVDGKTVNGLAPKNRSLAMVFQNYALYPRLTVRENIAFPLCLNHNKLPEQETRHRAGQTAEILELTGHLERKPANLLGGQRQRVAMGCAVVREANAFLFDEPLSDLDIKLRGRMRTEISRLQRRLGTTTIYVTHNQAEAMTLGDRVAVLRRGVLQQCASPRELYEEPVNLFTVGFIGSPPVDFLPATVQGDYLELPMAIVPIPDSVRQDLAGKEVVITGLRPEHIRDAEVATSSAGAVVFNSVVNVTEWLGNEQYAYIPFQSGPSVQNTLEELGRDLNSEDIRTQLAVNLDPRPQILEGEEAKFCFMSRNMMVFDPESGRNLTRDEQSTQRVTERSEKTRKRALGRARTQDNESSKSGKKESR